MRSASYTKRGPGRTAVRGHARWRSLRVRAIDRRPGGDWEVWAFSTDSAGVVFDSYCFSHWRKPSRAVLRAWHRFLIHQTGNLRGVKARRILARQGP